ncbi:hypothetical protein NLU13_1136 [Sarocladium strictum]|uniref:DUF7707 domain-containing protein n=1 Tax=Sarocladium strictum TaxID=5046 RepID=A0AA39LBZ0_SARSR|nr:hypothetical protein NLU13_1136 [Sarocladium strictum]
MPSLRSSALAVAMAFAAIAHADYNIDPESVPLSKRQQWCQSETSTCPIICQQVEPRTTLVNDCEPETLTYGCLCGNNKRPNMTEYTLTLPFFVCQEWGNQCVTACNGNNACASACREDHPCGASDPAKQTPSTTGTSTTKPTASSTNDADDENTIFTNSPGSGDNAGGQDNGSSKPTNGNEPGAAAALSVGKAYGLAMVMGGLFAGFALL